MSASFDDPNLISTAGLVPIMQLADAASLPTLAQDRLSITGDKGANAGAKITTVIAGMVAGADSIDDMDQLRHGGMRRLFDRIYAPSTLGSFLRACPPTRCCGLPVSDQPGHTSPSTDPNPIPRR